MSFRKTNDARPIPASFAKRDRLPLQTPIVGDWVSYLSVLGDILTPERALELLREGRTVMFETFEEQP